MNIFDVKFSFSFPNFLTNHKRILTSHALVILSQTNSVGGDLLSYFNTRCFLLGGTFRFEFSEISSEEWSVMFRNFLTEDNFARRCRNFRRLLTANFRPFWLCSRNFRLNGSLFGNSTIFGFSGNFPRNSVSPFLKLSQFLLFFEWNAPTLFCSNKFARQLWYCACQETWSLVWKTDLLYNLTFFLRFVAWNRNAGRSCLGFSSERWHHSTPASRILHLWPTLRATKVQYVTKIEFLHTGSS